MADGRGEGLKIVFWAILGFIWIVSQIIAKVGKQQKPSPRQKSPQQDFADFLGKIAESQGLAQPEPQQKKATPPPAPAMARPLRTKKRVEPPSVLATPASVTGDRITEWRPTKRKKRATINLKELIGSRTRLRNAIIAREIIGPPVGMRK